MLKTNTIVYPDKVVIEILEGANGPDVLRDFSASIVDLIQCKDETMTLGSNTLFSAMEILSLFIHPKIKEAV